MVEPKIEAHVEVDGQVRALSVGHRRCSTCHPWNTECPSCDFDRPDTMKSRITNKGALTRSRERRIAP